MLSTFTLLGNRSLQLAKLKLYTCLTANPHFPLTQSLTTTFLFSVYVVLTSLDISQDVIQYLSFWDWLNLPSIMPLRLLHVVGIPSFLRMKKSSSDERIGRSELSSLGQSKITMIYITTSTENDLNTSKKHLVQLKTQGKNHKDR